MRALKCVPAALRARKWANLEAVVGGGVPGGESGMVKSARGGRVRLWIWVRVEECGNWGAEAGAEPWGSAGRGDEKAEVMGPAGMS